MALTDEVRSTEDQSVLLATSSSEGISVPLLCVAAAAALGWLVLAAVVGVARRAPHIRAAEAGMDLPAESPAVAGMLANDFVVPAETAPAILLDLAARGVVDLDEVQPGKTICRVRRGDRGTLTAAETRVLDAITGKAIDGVVPTDALTTGTEDHSKGWHRALQREVVAESQAADLTYDRWPKRWLALLGVGLVAIFGIVILAAQVGGDVANDEEVLAIVAGAVTAGVLAVGVLFVGRLGRSLAQLPTDAGRAAAARVGGLERHLHDDSFLAELPPAAVKVRGRHLAYAAAFGAAPLAVALLPMGAEDDHRAWSRVGGRWRRVRVRYPRRWPPGWGAHPILATFGAVVAGALLIVAITFLVGLTDSRRPVEITTDAWDWVQTGLVVVIALLGFGVLVAAAILVRAVPDMFTTRSVTGEIVRARRYQIRSSQNSTTYVHYLAVDDGTRDHIAAFRVRSEMWHEHSQGDTVTAVVTPRLGYVRSITRS